MNPYINLLQHARGGCSCESYYRYTCGLCRAVAEGENTERWERLREHGLVKSGGYSPYEITDAGQAVLDGKMSLPLACTEPVEQFPLPFGGSR